MRKKKGKKEKSPRGERKEGEINCTQTDRRKELKTGERETMSVFNKSRPPQALSFFPPLSQPLVSLKS